MLAEKFEIVKTADGSDTVYSPEFDEHYHSHHGALAESRHVFIGAGLDHLLRAGVEVHPVRIFEMGLGTGLNALLAWQFALDRGIPIAYTAVEKFPLPTSLCRRLNYPELPGMEATAPAFAEMLDAPWDAQFEMKDGFSLTKIHGDFLDVEMPAEHFDLVFFDAFGSRAQPRMWEEEVLQRCYEMLKPGGVWVTYASKGSARRTMEGMGFEVERIEGAPGKREMMRARKQVKS